MIKRVEASYRGIFQKSLGKYIGSDCSIRSRGSYWEKISIHSGFSSAG